MLSECFLECLENSSGFFLQIILGKIIVIKSLA